MDMKDRRPRMHVTIRAWSSQFQTPNKLPDISLPYFYLFFHEHQRNRYTEPLACTAACLADLQDFCITLHPSEEVLPPLSKSYHRPR